MRIRSGIALGLLVLVTAAGCGSADDADGVATAGGSTAASKSAGSSGQGDGVKFAQCMRQNGIENFPDPDPGSEDQVRITLPEGADPAKVQTAQKKCQQYLPNGGAADKPDPGRVEQLRQLAKCMREHGVTNYPDPAADGSMQIGGQSGLNPEDPTFKAAEQACAQYRPAAPSGGTMTKGNG